MSTWIVAIVIACIPTFAWLYFLFRDTEKRRGMIAGIFFLGILTVIPLLIIQYSWNFFPALNVQQEIPEHINNLYIAKTLTFIIFAMLEEVFKQWLLRFADKKWLIVRSINDSIRFSMIAAMGFSFAENVYPYFFALIQAHQYQSLIGAYFFRSLFTSAAHLFFSGIFGYYYGMAKFIPNYRDQSELQGKKLYFSRFICRLFSIPQDQAFREQKILQGLIIALGLHGIYNTFLDFGKIIYSLVIVLIGFAYLMVLLKRSSGQLDQIIDISETKDQALDQKNTNVILHLINKAFEEKKYKDVIGMCERFLQKNPDNKLAELFKKQSQDALQGVDLYHEATEMVGERKKVEDKSNMEQVIQKAETQKSTMAKDFQDSEAYKKFLEEEQKKKDEAETFKVDIPQAGGML